MRDNQNLPRIGVSVSSRTGWRVFPFFAFALWRAGAVGVKIHARRKRNNLAGLDGVIIGGGDDISVDLYGGELLPNARFDHARDRLEIALITEAEERGLPMLGVCRGAQLINVVRGGTLHEDIHAEYPDAKRLKTPLPRKTVTIAEGSRLARLMGDEPSRVNALHTQSVDRPGRDIRAVAWDEAGVVQAVECTAGRRFVLGVQWHPEYLIASRRDWKLFASLVENAKSPAVADAADTADHPDAPSDASADTPSDTLSGGTAAFATLR
ncbi:MAG: gamma-glutamyl-gamma-aminobutyrate hydrolase family protein [Pseudomonadota bacterium]